LLETFDSDVPDGFDSVVLEALGSDGLAGAESLEPDDFDSLESGVFDASEAAGLLELLELLESVL
jgi:hypothetical protein